MAKAAPIVELTQQQVAAIQNWDAIKTQQRELDSVELGQRLELIKGLPFVADKEEGGQSIKLNAGWKMTLDKPMNYSADKDTAKINAGLQALGAVNPTLAYELIRWEPVVSVSAYKKLTKDEKQIVAAFISMKPGTPSLALVPPPVPKGE